MLKIKYIFPILFVLLFLNVKNALADAYLVHLYYNTTTKTLTFDKLTPENVSLDKNISPSISEFTQESETVTGAYILTFYDRTNSEIISTQFDKQDGAFQLTIPYFSIATSLKIFEKSTGKELLNADLSNFTTCNGNGICEFEKGETAKNCLGDCATSQPKFSPQTLDLLKKNNGVIKDPTTGEILLKGGASSESKPIQQQPTPQKNSLLSYILIALGIIAIFVAGWFLYKKFIKNKSGN